METRRIEIEPTDVSMEAYLLPLNRPGDAGLPLGEFTTVGRDRSCQLALEDAYVSARHARIERRTGGFVIRDLQSRNGTFLNGSRIAEAILTPNDRLRFGNNVFVFSHFASSSPQLSSRNKEWNEQLSRLPSFASTDLAVLITGPSGAGKEVLANAVHQNSGRSKGPYISINCSALNESLIESELFGHVRGSFTGATHDRKGAFETARSGTLFLDEIGDLPLALQPKLLRALENNEIRPVGSDRVIQTDVRIIAATHKNLALQVKAGAFREDLYYRLNVCNLRLPALKERIEDFEDLLYVFAKQHRVRFSFSAIESLKKLPWPGNIRELKNSVARASAYHPGKHIQPDDLPSILDPIQPSVQHEPSSTEGLGFNGPIIKELERQMIVRRLVANKGNQRRTAMDLGLPKSTLHDRIRTYSIDLKKIEQGHDPTNA